MIDPNGRSRGSEEATGSAGYYAAICERREESLHSARGYGFVWAICVRADLERQEQQNRRRQRQQQRQQQLNDDDGRAIAGSLELNQDESSGCRRAGALSLSLDPSRSGRIKGTSRNNFRKGIGPGAN